MTSKRASAFHKFSQTDLVDCQPQRERLGFHLQLNVPWKLGQSYSYNSQELQYSKDPFRMIKSKSFAIS